MPTSTEESSKVSPLSSADTIPSLAIRAASELDAIIEKRATNSPTSQRLGEVLLEAIKGTKNGKKSVSIGSGTVAVFCHAFEQLPEPQPISKMSDLVEL